MKKIIILLSCLIVTATVSTQAQGWNTVNFPVPENINGVSFLGEDTAFFVTNKGNLVRSFDKLKSFDTFNPAPAISLEDVHFLNSNIGFICGAKGTLMKTVDGGYTFKKIEITDTIAWLFDVEMFDSKHGLVIGLSLDEKSPFTGIAFRTSDGGESWTKTKTIGLGVSEIGYYDNQIVVQSFGRLNYSSDYGKTWVSKQTVSGSPGRSFSLYEKTGVICGLNGMVAYTNDGGNIWLPSDKQSDQKVFVASQMINKSEGYIGGQKSTLLKTTDGGRSWSPELMAKSFDVYDLILVNKRIYAVGAEGGIIWKNIK